MSRNMAFPIPHPACRLCSSLLAQVYVVMLMSRNTRLRIHNSGISIAIEQAAVLATVLGIRTKVAQYQSKN